jgi:hypothetical protein
MNNFGRYLMSSSDHWPGRPGLARIDHKTGVAARQLVNRGLRIRLLAGWGNISLRRIGTLLLRSGLFCTLLTACYSETDTEGQN